MEAVQVDFSTLAFFLNIPKNLGCFGLQIIIFCNPFQPNVCALSTSGNTRMERARYRSHSMILAWDAGDFT